MEFLQLELQNDRPFCVLSLERADVELLLEWSNRVLTAVEIEEIFELP